MAFAQNPAVAKAGLVLCRIVVPVWVLTGAVFKLVENSPRMLPKETILTAADAMGIHLYGLLATLIALELLTVVVMVFLARFARAAAIFVLSVFCLVLIGEIALGNFTSCGCLGSISPPPWIMLIIDGTLLGGVLLFKPPATAAATPARRPLLAAVALILVGFGTSFGVVVPAGRAPASDGSRQGTDGNTIGTTDPTINPDPAPLPGYWFASDVESWIGTPWREVDLFTYLPRWPRDMDGEMRYVVLYSRTCDHCEDMFHQDLTDPALGSMVTAIEVPDSKTQMTSPDAWPMPETECERLQLPLGCDWILTSPLTITVEGGIVTCATEGDHKRCMGLE
ncbi:MAG: MauE/DoxX family redox-associated membrane protein [Planctomycetota bacterium]|jgi:hypothetical protein